jgi:hypothetical protein
MPINCELKREDVRVLWTNFDNGEEIEKPLHEFRDFDEIETWIEELEKTNE